MRGRKNPCCLIVSMDTKWMWCYANIFIAKHKQENINWSSVNVSAVTFVPEWVQGRHMHNQQARGGMSVHIVCSLCSTDLCCYLASQWNPNWFSDWHGKSSHTHTHTRARAHMHVHTHGRAQAHAHAHPHIMNVTSNADVNHWVTEYLLFFLILIFSPLRNIRWIIQQ